VADGPGGRHLLGSRPCVAASARSSLGRRPIEQHSDTLEDPIRRFHRTFSVMFTMVFGILEQSLNAARRLHYRHATIRGRLRLAAGPFPAGSFYCANGVSVLRWVHATLTDSALIAHSLVLPPFTQDQRESYHSESRAFAALFGIPRACLARDWTSFSGYMDAMVQSRTLSVTDPARVIAQQLLAGAHVPLPVPASYRALTAELLPPRLRQEFALRNGGAERRAAERLVARVRAIYPLLPSRLRYVGPYQEAEQRLAGRAQPDYFTRVCNRFLDRSRRAAELTAVLDLSAGAFLWWLSCSPKATPLARERQRFCEAGIVLQRSPRLASG
jgi:uncharacterized protein (DUF2236 family)